MSGARPARPRRTFKLRRRLSWLALATLLATVAVVVVATDTAFAAFQRRELGGVADREVERVAAMVRSGTPGDRFVENEATRLQFVTSNGQVVIPDAGAAPLPAVDEPTVHRRPLPDLEGAWMVAQRPWRTPSGLTAGTIRLAVPMGPALATRGALRRVLVLTGLVALAAGVAISFLTLRRALGPLQGLARQARDVDPTDPRLVEYGGPADEVGMLADGLGRALDGIRAHRNAERERLADVAHELSAPLTVITNHLRRLDRELGPDASHAGRERLRAAQAAGDELLVSSQDLLTVLRGDLQDRLEWHVVDLRTLAAQVVSAYPGVHLDEGPSEASAILDPVRTRQIVRNLVRNAVRAAGRPDGVRVEVATEADGQRVRLVVADDGPGVTPEEREAVFGRYVTGGGSTGLGLAVVQRLVAAQGGTVDVASEPGEGAAFTVAFPSAEAMWDEDADEGPHPPPTTTG